MFNWRQRPRDLEALAKAKVSRERVQRWTKRIGNQRVAQIKEHARGFNAAKRKAFVADGVATNWSVHRQHFSHYTPILDFTHAVYYVYAAALAGQSLGNGWRKYCQWAQWLWEGANDQLIAAVKARSEELGPPPDGDETSSAAVVARTLGYLGNQRPRMKYDEYRKLGLSPAILSQPSSRSTAV